MRPNWIPLNFMLAAFLIVGSCEVLASGEINSNVDIKVHTDVPRVLASIAPIHGLVSRIMSGVGVPELMISESVSPHAYSLKPSDAIKLSSADIVFWVGPALETAMGNSIQALAGNARVISFMNDPDIGFNIHSTRKVGVIASDHNHDHSESGASQIGDPHIWLDPLNAAIMLKHIAAVLADVDPTNASIYLSNAQDGTDELDELNIYIEKQLSVTSVMNRPVVFFHDAYQYFEHRFNIKPLAIIQTDHDHGPGAKRVHEIRTVIKLSGIVCVFSESQFSPKLLATLIEGTQAKHGVLDPVGIDLILGDEFYISMMTNFVDAFVRCGP